VHSTNFAANYIQLNKQITIQKLRSEHERSQNTGIKPDATWDKPAQPTKLPSSELSTQSLA
jgi:hypothetical protein